jgi:hypothetical protein
LRPQLNLLKTDVDSVSFTFSQYIAIVVWLVDVFIGFLVIGKPHSFGIPQEFLLSAQGNIAQQNDFGDGAAIIKVTPGRFTSLAGSYPLLIVS